MKISILLTVILFSAQLNSDTLAATFPSAVPGTANPGKLNNVTAPIVHQGGNVKIHSPAIRVRRTAGIKQRILVGLMKYKVVRKLIGIDEPTEKQRKLGRLSLIFAIAAIALVAIPYAALAIPAAFAVASFPLAVAGLVLGIKSIKGNTNTMGLVGLILSGAFLLLLILSVLFLAVSFSSWN